MGSHVRWAVVISTPCNTLRFEGKPLKSYICDSVLHLMRGFPHYSNKDIVLSTCNRCDSCYLTKGSRNSAMLDSNCSFFVTTSGGLLSADFIFQ